MNKVNAICRANIDAGIALNALRRREHCLHIAIQAALGLLISHVDIEAQLYFKLTISEGQTQAQKLSHAP